MLRFFMVGNFIIYNKNSLHFRYNGKKYLYGLSQELLTCGQQSGNLKKLNGTYEPNERQKQQKSPLLLKKEKSLLKIDYIIIPRRPCINQYLWHFQQFFEKLKCRHFLILSQKQKNEQEFKEDSILKNKLMSLLSQRRNENTKFTDNAFKIECFYEHEGYVGSSNPFIKSNVLSPIQSQNLRSVHKDPHFQDKNIYQSTIERLILSLCLHSIKQLSLKSAFYCLNYQGYADDLQRLLNTIRNNNLNNPQLNLNPQQIKKNKIELQNLIFRISHSNQAYFPTLNNQMKLIFLPQTSMITILHKSQIMLINPCNLVSWRLYYSHIPVQKVRFVILTRFSMAFMQFLITWSVTGQQHKVKSQITIATLDFIYLKIKQALKRVFLWDDEMIRSKIAFRVIPSNPEQNKRIEKQNSRFYPLGFVKISYLNELISQEKWIIRFGNKQICFLNQMILFQQSWTNQFECVIFDRVNQTLKNNLYKRTQIKQQMSQKLVFNRSSQSKFRNKFFKFIDENCPILNIQSQISIEQTFLPFYSSLSETGRYSKVRLLPGQTINGLDRNIILIQGLTAALNDEVTQRQVNGQSRTHINTRVHLCFSPDFSYTFQLQNLKFNKLRHIKELIALKQSIILVEEKQHEIFYENLQLKDGLSNSSQQQNSSQRQERRSLLYLTQKQDHEPSNKTTLTPLKNTHQMQLENLQVSNILGNSLIKVLSRRKNNFGLSYISGQFQKSAIDEQKQLVQVGCPLWQLNQVFSKVTFQSGQVINEDNSKVYFIVKGSMKWKTTDQNETRALNNSFIGNLEMFYKAKVSKQNHLYGIKVTNNHLPIEVIKDTWALQANMEDFHSNFLVKYPQVAYFIIQKGKMFT